MANTKNLIKAEVSALYDASATSIVLEAGAGATLPAVPFYLTWWDSTTYADPSDDPNVEIVEVTVVTTDTLTVTRGVQGIVATTKNTAASTYKMVHGVTAFDLGALVQLSSLSKTLYLDLNNGDDTSAKRGHPHRAYSTIQTAIAALTDGDTLIVRAGTYTVTPGVSGPSSDLGGIKLNGLSDIRIIGDPGAIISTGSVDGDLLTITDCDHLLIQGMEFRGDGQNVRGGGNPAMIGVIFAQIHLRNTSPGNTNINIHQCKFWGGRDHAIGHLFSPRNTRGVRITNCHFERQGAIETGTPNYDGTSIASVGSDVIIANNTFYNTLRGVEFEGVGPQKNITVIGNTFNKVWELAVMLFATSADYQDYQGITVQGNTFLDGDFVSNAPTTLSPVPAAAAIQFNGGQTLAVVGNAVQDYQFGIDVRAGFASVHGVVIDGNTFQNVSAKVMTIWGPHTGSYECKMISVTGNIIHSSSQRGIVARAKQLLISGNIITNCAPDGIKLEDSGGSGNDPVNVRIANNIVTQIDGYTGMNYGVEVQTEFTSVVINDNDLTNATTAGILDNGTTTVDRNNSV